jgi:ABC-type dipeptide/oligopeptide/nickel transport system ATPase subunit
MTLLSPNAPSLLPPDTRPLLEVDNIDVVLGRGWRAAPVLSGVSLQIRPGEIVGLVGETGSGKTTLARTIVGLIPPKRGRVLMAGPGDSASPGDSAGPGKSVGPGSGSPGATVISGLRGRARRAARRGGRIQFVFQDPLRSLDPELTVERIVGEGLAIRGAGPGEIRNRVVSALEKVGLDAGLLSRTPGQISGGQRQRVSIARALAAGPELLICDEPVSALDASNRNYVLRLLAELRDSLGLSILIISHDLSSLAGIADRVAVLYRGRIVEDGPVGAVFADPKHPYTALLMASAPSVREASVRDASVPDARAGEASGREGGVRPGRRLSVRQLRRGPADAAPPDAAGACVFAARCPFAAPACAAQPDLEPLNQSGAPVNQSGALVSEDGAGAGDRRNVACHRQQEWPALAAARKES